MLRMRRLPDEALAGWESCVAEIAVDARRGRGAGPIATRSRAPARCCGGFVSQSARPLALNIRAHSRTFPHISEQSQALAVGSFLKFALTLGHFGASWGILGHFETCGVAIVFARRQFGIRFSKSVPRRDHSNENNVCRPENANFATCWQLPAGPKVGRRRPRKHSVAGKDF